MVLLSGEVETVTQRLCVGTRGNWFRMVLLSGEVETGSSQTGVPVWGLSSGWFCYLGKLKLPLLRVAPLTGSAIPDGFAIRGS